MKLPVDQLRKDFPLLANIAKQTPFVYFDNAATTQKPFQVIEKMNYFYLHENANVHRGTYQLANTATEAYENAREKAAQYIHASSSSECIFTRGTTEAINLVAYQFTHQFLKAEDEILITCMEHHSNIVPWQIACQFTGANLRVVKCLENGELDLEDFKKCLNNKTKIVAIAHISNVLGTINPIKQCIALAHQLKIPVLIDGAQAAGHLSIDVQDLACDFYAFSAHKMYGPTGIGVLYAKKLWLDKFIPYQTGGEMISSVTFEKTEYNIIPHKFEAGTPAIAEAVGLGAAIDYLSQLSLHAIHSYEIELLHTLVNGIKSIPEISLVGEAHEKSGIMSFSVKNIHPHDLATYLDHHGIALRAGQLCAEPLLARFGYQSLLRVSFGLYNTPDEIHYFIQHLKNGIRYFQP